MNESIIVTFDLATRDQEIERINQLIKQKQSFLTDKSREIKKTVKDNKYLEIVKKEYDEYNLHLIDTKKKQLDAFKKLLSYIKHDGLLEYQTELLYKIKQLEKEIRDLR